MSSADAHDQTVSNLSVTRNIRAAGEVLLFALGTISAWMYGGNTPHVEYILSIGITFLVGLWLAHGFVSVRWRVKFDLCSGCLLGLILLCFVQLVPLPMDVVKVVAPARAELHEFLVPANSETLANETGLARPGMIPITVDATATRLLLARLISVFAVYTVVRSWLLSKGFVQRLLWVLTGNGTLLAVLALGQFFSSPRTLLYWSIDVGASVYGPFVCRNHYPDFLAWSIGAAIALVLTPNEEDRKARDKAQEQNIPVKFNFFDGLMELLTTPLKLLDRPATLIPAICLGVMLVSIPISLSRGGLIAYLVAGVGVWLLGRVSKPTGNSMVAWALTLTFGSFLALLLWFGVGPITTRFESIWQGGDNRSEGWKSSMTQVGGNWMVGTGAGSHQRVEPMGRTTQPPEGVYDHAHNEYLEALVEGGLLRLSLTLLLVLGTLALLAWGYWHRQNRSIGPTLLGMFFAMLVLAVHAFFDFGIHMPAVALVSAIGVAVGLGSTTDSALVPTRTRSKKKSSANLVLPAKPTTTSESPWLGIGVVVLLVGVMAILTLEARNRYRADRFDAAADSWRNTTRPERFDKRIEFQSARCRITPNDADAWADLGVAYLDAALDQQPDGRFSPALLQSHIDPALQALRTSRNLNPYLPQVQARLGFHARRFAEADPAVRYLERAVRLLPTDAELHYAVGVEAYRAGKTELALAEWKRSLELSSKWLRPILQEAKGVSGERLCEAVLPNQPHLLVQAANERHPDQRLHAAERRVFLERAMDYSNVKQEVSWSADQLAGVAEAGFELDQIQQVDKVIAMILSKKTMDAGMRNVVAGWYERQERYADAVEQLNWLVAYDGANSNYRERLRLARHGARLQKTLAEP
jgi:O-antigen ligase/tetratricopeptide (TPR) repeat protein